MLETAVCGDGVVGAGEACDDGNTADGDYCSADCSEELAICGDGIVGGDEDCDDGNTADGDACPANCSIVYLCGSDALINAAGTYAGTTSGAGNDFSQRGSGDYAYEFVVPTSGSYTFSLEGTPWDTYLYLLADNCSTTLESNDDVAGGTRWSRFTEALSAGQRVVILIEGYNASDSGIYTLMVTGP